GVISPARNALRHSLKLKPEQAEAAKMLAAIYLASGEGERGLELLKQASVLEPDDFRPWFAMGKVHHELGNLDDSGAAFGEALKRSPPAAEARESRVGRIRALLESNHAEAASSDVEEALKAYAEDAEVLALAARQARDVGRLDVAKELVERALARDPK